MATKLQSSGPPYPEPHCYACYDSQGLYAIDKVRNGQDVDYAMGHSKMISTKTRKHAVSIRRYYDISAMLECRVCKHRLTCLLAPDAKRLFELI